MLESVSSTTLDQVRQRVASLPGEADCIRWLEWFFADRSTRAISPYSGITVPDHTLALGSRTNFAAWREGLQLSPSDGWIYSRMAEGYLKLADSGQPDAAAYAEWTSRQAIRFAPWGERPWTVRTRSHGRAGTWKQLLQETEQALPNHEANPYLWLAHTRALDELRMFEPAVPAATRGLEFREKDPNAIRDMNLRSELLRFRSRACKGLGRLAEATADHLAYHDLPARDPAASSNLIDLGLIYNGGQGEEFPGGVPRLAGTEFDFRGWIQLDLRLIRPEIIHLPKEVNIPIGRVCRRLHFLQTAGYASYASRGTNEVMQQKLNTPFGVAVGRYVIRYADGQKVEVPIVHGRNVRDYYHYAANSPDDPELVVAWTGSTGSSRRVQARTRLYKQTWENPRPDGPIASLDFIHAGTHAVPILVALTAEP